MAEETAGPFSLPELPEPAGAGELPRPAQAAERGRLGERRRRRRTAWRPGDRTLLARSADGGLRWGVPALLLFAPLAWGSVEPWSEALLLGGAAALAALWMLRIAADPVREMAERAATTHLRSWSAGMLAPLAALLLLPLVQLLPLGPLAGALSPSAAQLHDLAGGPARLTAAPEATVLAAAEIAALALLFLAVVGSLRSRAEVRTLAVVLVALGFLHAVAGTLWHLSEGWRAFGLDRRVGTSFGPFVNRNHFANLMAMTIPVGVGLLLSLRQRRRAGRGGGERDARDGGKEREVVPRQVLAGLAVVVMVGALALSLSRGGMASACLALAAYAVAAATLRRTRGRIALLAVAAAAAVGFSAWLGGEALLARLGTLGSPLGERSFTARLDLWSATLRMAADHPLLGAGLGSYGSAFPRYQDSHPDLLAEHAHADWLQLLAEGGVAGVLVALALAGAYLSVLFRVLRRRRDAEPILLALGGLAGLVAFVAHGAAEFSLHVPANALWFAVLAAWTLKAAASRIG